MTTSDDPAASRVVRPSEVDAATSRADLVRLLAEQYARADVSLRELELRANRAGGARLPRATCSDMLAGRRFPKKAVMVAFLRACQVPEEQLPDWERAWERMKISQISLAPVSGADQDGPVPQRSLDGPVPQRSLDGPVPQRSLDGPVSQRSLDRPAQCSFGEGEGEGEGGEATAGRQDQPARGRKPAWRRIGLPAGLAAATGLVTVIGLFALIDSRSSPHPVIDDGRAFGSGGSSRFTVAISPDGGEVRLTRRLDAGIAKQTALVAVDGVLAALWQPLPEGPHGWTDQSVVLPVTLTMGRRRLAITNTFVSSDLDFNEFTYFVDQKVDGAWSRADTVDVGPNHLDSEAAHGYRVTNESWSGTHPFTYLK
ncbi:hypothetical protein [Nonomuraea sp. NPDC050643]|uniref:hypothetical protein n=1 Tax=Nonomuraea sp. NPDC050643 TaxID=3155660 RepID=UPI003410D00D